MPDVTRFLIDLKTHQRGGVVHLSWIAQLAQIRALPEVDPHA